MSPGMVLWLRSALAAATALLLGCSASRREQAQHAELVVVGDVMFAGTLDQDLRRAGLSYDALFAHMQRYVRDADWAALNFESAATSDGQAIEKEFTFNSSAEGVAALARAGFDLANLANNHCLDYGAIGLSETVAELARWNLQPLGVRHENDPQIPLIVDFHGLRVGFLGYADPESAYAYAPEFLSFSERPAAAEEGAVARDLATLRPEVDAIVVSVHWGLENAPVSERQRELGHFFVEHGAALVVGHHPHVQQPAEWFEGGLILYSLGNFVFGDWAIPEHLQSRLFRIELTASGVESAEYLSLSIDPQTWTPVPDSGAFVRATP